jgi:hypothetical protein
VLDWRERVAERAAPPPFVMENVRDLAIQIVAYKGQDGDLRIDKRKVRLAVFSAFSRKRAHSRE